MTLDEKYYKQYLAVFIAVRAKLTPIDSLGGMFSNEDRTPGDIAMFAASALATHDATSGNEPKTRTEITTLLMKMQANS